jgi:hypothetical protein
VGGWGVEEDDEEGGGYQLLRVAHKVEAVGINYCRSAKQVGKGGREGGGGLQ